MRQPLNIVQVHLGSSIPLFLYDQIRQTRLFNPDTPLYLIVDDNVSVDAATVRNLSIVVVRKSTINQCRNGVQFVRKNRLKSRGLSGFWLYASERFFVIESFLAACELINIIHIDRKSVV